MCACCDNHLTPHEILLPQLHVRFTHVDTKLQGYKTSYLMNYVFKLCLAYCMSMLRTWPRNRAIRSGKKHKRIEVLPTNQTYPHVKSPHTHKLDKMTPQNENIFCKIHHKKGSLGFIDWYAQCPKGAKMNYVISLFLISLNFVLEPPRIPCLLRIQLTF